MTREKDKEILNKEYILLLFQSCKIFLKRFSKPQNEIFLKAIFKQGFLTITEALKIYDKVNPMISSYWEIWPPSSQTIRRSLNRVSPKENGCSQKLKKVYNHIIDMTDTKVGSSSRTSSVSNAPKKQKLFWGVNFGGPPGAYIEGLNGDFIPWDQLSFELVEQVANSLPKIITIPATIKLDDHFEKKNWIIKIHDKKGNHSGDIWIGSNPEKNWEMDGKIRIGKTISDYEWVVWQVYERYSDGSYRLLRSI